MTDHVDNDGAASPKLGFRPLYQQVRDMFVRRLVDGRWTPGQALPSEMELAAEIGVSQGTVRKALDALAAENLVVRRQGRGTFVAEHDEARILFQFFKLAPDDGERAFPESRVIHIARGAATPEEGARLALKRRAQVIRIDRVRLLGGRPAISERVTLPAALFPGLDAREVPNNLYGLYAAGYGVTVANARERLKAVGLPPEQAAHLDVAPGAPALLIDRLAIALDGSPVEWRVSYCLTDGFHYASDLR
ncbi:GntR family transcriptional regulator [Alsobacter sp. SYSU M60028]|uniref:GntR family transcriptional regulator n=1 Tax=Alsobacter ponti TaxID=2962936 RepID=A0ABT1L9R2_9HYPH|nr:GntR family transcriptional regulator [Alsobacter ponti]MCP8937701.1 GntR family transcriptional regulator [Alsobacter ponti]